MNMRELLCAICAASLASLTHAGEPLPELDVRVVATGVYAVVGDLRAQSRENEGLNANLGFVVGNEAVLAVNSGPSRRVGEAMLAAIREITPLPVKWVVNLNSQSHYWWGNAVFQEAGATLLAHPAGIELMGAQRELQRDALAATLGDRFDGSDAVIPDRAAGERSVLDLGGRTVELLHFGPAHTPGDLAVWVPDASTVFSGDLVYTERLLAVLPVSSSAGWADAFRQMEKLSPTHIIPGHGAPTDHERARRDTLDYIEHLRAAALAQFERGATPSEAAVAIDQTDWAHLANFDQLARANANRVFVEVEAEAF